MSKNKYFAELTYSFKRLKRKLLKPFWWRKFYIRVRITEAEALKGRCPLCQASCQAFRKNIYNIPSVRTMHALVTIMRDSLSRTQNFKMKK